VGEIEKVRTSLLRCSIKTCSETSSVKIEVVPPAAPYEPPLMCVVDGFSLERRNRAWDPPWSQTMYRGIGFRSASRSWIGKQSEREGEKVDDEQLNSDRDS
jgi:hypothetical protein